VRLFPNYLSPHPLKTSSIPIVAISFSCTSILQIPIHCYFPLIYLIATVYTRTKHAIEQTLIMPSVVDKASQISLHRKRSALRKSYHSGKKHFTKFCLQFNFPSIIPTHRLASQRSDMPRSGSEKQAIATRNKRSSETPESTEHRNSRPVPIPPLTCVEPHTDSIFQKQSSGGSHKSQARKDQESGQGRRGSPASK
jgi:hypothetical protein